MSDINPLGQVQDGQDGSMGLLRTPSPPQTSERLNFTGSILTPTRILNDHLQYRQELKIRVEVDYSGSTFKEVVVVDPDSTQRLVNCMWDSSKLLLVATASCVPCATTQDSDDAHRCTPQKFTLPPSVEGTFLRFDDLKTHFSGVVTLKVPSRYRRPSPGQWSRCDAESLAVLFTLESGFEIVATSLVQTRLRARTHQALPQLQPTYSVPPQASHDWGIADTTVLPLPPPPQIVDVNPPYGPHFTSQRVWVKVDNLPRGNYQNYLIGFGHAGVVTTSFVTSEGDRVQILECTTPTTPPSYPFSLSLMRNDDPDTPIGSSHIQYTSAPRY